MIDVISHLATVSSRLEESQRSQGYIFLSQIRCAWGDYHLGRAFGVN